MIALRERWTETSRLYSLGKTLFTRRNRFALDVGIAWQNYRDEAGVFQEIDLTPEASDIAGFDLMVTRTPYRAYFTLDGRRRIYPFRHRSDKYLEFPPPAIMAGKTMLAGSQKLLAEGADYDVEIGWENSRVTFDTVLHQDPGFDSMSFPVIQQGVSDAELRALLGTPTVYEMDGELSREMDVSIKNGLISLGFDLTGMKFPVVVDPTLDLQVGAGADDGRHRNNHTMGITTNWLSLGKLGSGAFFSSFIRFTGVTVPNAATVDVSFVTFTAEFARTATTVKTLIHLHDDDNSAAPTDDTEWHAVVDANLTTASAAFNIAENWVVNTEYDTSSLNGPLEELFARGGWSSGNAATIVLIDNGSDAGAFREPWSYDGSTAKASKLHIEYTAGGGNGGGGGHARRRRRRRRLIISIPNTRAA